MPEKEGKKVLQTCVHIEIIYSYTSKALPCMMDPAINGLSFESPSRLSLGKALLINPERCTNITTLKQNECLVNDLENKRITLKWGAISARMCPAHGSFYHVVSAFECVFS